MITTTLDLPAMYADHHVQEVRRILLALPGVAEVYASSAFQAVEVSFNPAQLEEAAISAALAEAGYLGDLAQEVETDQAPYLQDNSETAFRHTAVYENVRQVVSFARTVPATGRPLWPCPGMGVMKTGSVRQKLEE